MRCLYVTHGGGSAKEGLPSGSTRVAVDLAVGHSKGVVPSVVFLGQNGGGSVAAKETLDRKGVPYRDVEWRGRNNLAAMLAAMGQLYRIIRVEKPEVVCLNAVPATYLGWIPARLARVPLVLAVVHLVPADGKEKALARFLRFSDHVVFVSAGLRSYYCRSHAGLKGSVIQNGIDLARFSHLAARGFTSPPYFVTMVSRLHPPHKDPITLLRALALLRQRGYSVRLRFVGDGDARAEIEARATEWGVEDQVEVTGYTDRVAEFLEDTDIFALSTRWEGQPLSVMEAMAVGLPVVASRVIGVTDTIEDGQTGLLVPPGDPEALAAAIGSLIDNPEEALRMGRNARLKALKDFDVARMVREYEDLIRNLLDQNAHSR